MEGILIYHELLQRPDLALRDGHLLGGLHCGDCLELWQNGQWESARLEYMDCWVVLLDGNAIAPPYGAWARMMGQG